MRLFNTFFKIELLLIAVLFSASLSCYSPELSIRDCDGNTCLHYAVFHQDIAEAKRLIRAGVDINAVNNYGLTPIRCAAAFNNRDMMNILVSGGARTNYLSPESKSPSHRGFEKSIIRYPEERLNFFLTFDTGSDDRNLDYILKTLKRYKIIATFFTTGEFIKKYPKDIRRIADEGHVVGNHTFTHNMNYPNADILLNELYETELLYKKVTGREMARIWRSPGLQHIDNQWMVTEAEKLGYRHIDVNLGSADWLGPDESRFISNEKFLAIFKTHLNMRRGRHAIIDRFNYWNYYMNKPDYHGTIMLMHAGSFREEGKDFVYTLDEIIRYLLSSGYVFDNCRKFEYVD